MWNHCPKHKIIIEWRGQVECPFCKLQDENERLKRKVEEEYNRGVKDGLNQAADIVKNV